MWDTRGPCGSAIPSRSPAPSRRELTGTRQPATPWPGPREIFRILDDVLRRLGSRLENVLRLRVHYADPGIGPGFSRALREAFPGGAPALTGLRVTGLVDPEFLLEVEADAVAGEWESEAPPVPEWDEDVD